MNFSLQSLNLASYAANVAFVMTASSAKLAQRKNLQKGQKKMKNWPFLLLKNRASLYMMFIGIPFCTENNIEKYSFDSKDFISLIVYLGYLEGVNSEK